MRIGIDCGSTTVKVVVTDDNGNILFQNYARHMSKVRERTLEMLREAEPIIETAELRVAVTGSAGLGVAGAADLPFVQEVYATAGAVERLYPNTDSVIELGGEDAKIIFFTGGLEQRMNGSCAGGTGAFIDQMATLLDISVPELDEIAKSHEKIYPIASRCGVFAKSDIQPLLNQGAKHADIAASVLQAVVSQTIAGLAQGRDITGNVMFLGGPLTFIKSLRERFVKTLELSENEAIFPENGDTFVALGASFSAENYDTTTYAELSKKLLGASETISKSPLDPLFETELEYKEFVERHEKATIPEKDIADYSGKAYLGIDAGSTTTKLVLLDENSNILHSYYAGNKGNPVSVVKEQLEKIYSIIGDKIQICGSAVTGYGEELIKSAFNIDLGLVETMAHYKAASHFNPNVDFILDIGGQDIKCFKIKNHSIDSILLNEACSSGCGSFIETYAKALDFAVPKFAKLGLFARNPVDLGSRCTVFMNSSIKQAQKDGATVEDISAGLSVSVVKNALYKVIRARNGAELGDNIVVQGGTMLNDAILRALEVEIGKQVIRPTISGLMGAFGAALSVMQMSNSTLITSEKLESFSHIAKSTKCKLCGNNCDITINTFPHGKNISGNRCSRPVSGGTGKELPNLYEYKYNRLIELSDENGEIGIPLGLNMFENLPFWHALFKTLGYSIRLSDKSSRDLYQLGQHTVPSDTVCYPAKLIHGSIESLVAGGANKIFYPCLPYNFDEGLSDNIYNCPVVAYYPELLSANVPKLGGVDFMFPYFGLHRRKDFEKKGLEYFSSKFSFDKSKWKKAVDNAYKALEDFQNDIKAEGERAIKYARENGKQIIVLSGRPYHVDPEINHGMDRLLSGLDCVVISEDAIAHKVEKAPLEVLNQWTYHARMYSAARYVCTQPDMQMIQLVSFGCGVDAITTDELRNILEGGGKFYTQIKIDEISNLGAAKIRVRSLLEAVKRKA